MLDADKESDMTHFEYRLQALENRKYNCMITPPARPTQKCDWGGAIILEPLFLKASEDGLVFVTITQNNGQFNPSSFPTSNSLSGNTKLKNLHFPADWGFRLGIGLNLPYDGWEIDAKWTRFFTHAKRHIHADTDHFLTPTFLNPQRAINTDLVPPLITLTGAFPTEGLLNDATSHWTLHLNEIDLEIGREFFVSKWLTLKPYAGLRSAWIRQKNKIFYDGFFQLTGFIPVVSNVTTSMHCNFWGIGLLGGLDTQWGLFCGWSLFANLEASILYGYFDVSSHESDAGLSRITFLSPTFPFATDIFTLHDFYHLNRFITDCVIGLRYDYQFCDQRYHLGFQAGWEMHHFFGQNQFLKFMGGILFPAKTIANQGDLVLQGLSAQIAFDF